MKKFHRIAVAALALTLTAGLGTGLAEAGNGYGKDKAGPEGKVPIFPLAQKAGFNTLAKAIQVAGLQKALTTGGPFTVFAPTDEAFAKLPAGTLESLLSDPEALKQVLLYHVVAGEVPASEVVNLTEATTLNGATIAIDTSNGVMVNNAKVLKTDVMAKNGIIHVIDTVLVP